MNKLLRTRARALVLSVILVAGSGVLAPSAAASAGASKPRPAVPGIDWKPCQTGVECATVAVPLDYDRPNGRMISLSVKRLPAADPARRLGSLFINPGGPGPAAGAVSAAGTVYPQELRDRFDLVAFDPRGTGDSTLLRCFTSQAEADAVRHDEIFPITAQQESDWPVKDREFADACTANAGPIIDHMSTANGARDLDLLRRAVGDAQLNFLGYSYGTYLGQTYANMYPRNVGAMVIDSVLDPIAWSTGSGRQAKRTPFTTRIQSSAGSEETFEQFLLLCDQAGAACSFSGGAATRFDALAERLRVQPIPNPNFPDQPLTYQLLIEITTRGLYNPPIWPYIADFLVAAEAGVAASTAAALGSLEAAEDAVGGPAGAGAAREGALERVEAPSATDYIPVEAVPAVGCSDSRNPSSTGAWATASDRDAKKNPFLGPYWTWFSSVCAVWPGRDHDRYLGPWNARTANPVLVVNSRFDPSTPYSGAVTASRLLKNSRLLTYAGWGHKVFATVGSDCIDGAVVSYFIDRTLPPRGTVCQPKASPFDPDFE